MNRVCSQEYYSTRREVYTRVRWFIEDRFYRWRGIVTYPCAAIDSIAHSRDPLLRILSSPSPRFPCTPLLTPSFPLLSRSISTGDRLSDHQPPRCRRRWCRTSFNEALTHPPGVVIHGGVTRRARAKIPRGTTEVCGLFAKSRARGMLLKSTTDPPTVLTAPTRFIPADTVSG